VRTLRTPSRVRVWSAVLAAVAFALLYTAAHVGIGGSFQELLIGALLLLPAGIALAYVALRGIAKP
jgi:hypothetical protein